jgi:hypothetical protein
MQHHTNHLVDMENIHNWRYITAADPVYKASNCAPSDMYRNGKTDLADWIPQNIANGILKEGLDFFLNLSDVKKFWRDNVKPYVPSPVRAAAPAAGTSGRSPATAVPICLDMTGAEGKNVPSSSSSSSSSGRFSSSPDFLKNIPQKKRARLRKKLDLLIQEGEQESVPCCACLYYPSILLRYSSF